MFKSKKNIFIFISLILVAVLSSYFLYKTGNTNRIKGFAQMVNNNINRSTNSSDYPVINNVFNSSGEELINSDIAVTINASSTYNINKIEFSYDLKKWNVIDVNKPSKEINDRIIFDKTINSKLYVRVVNEMNNKSYPYETYINIDKTNPSIIITKTNNSVFIRAKDNYDLESIQYSNDKENWDEELISGTNTFMRKDNFNYKYVRAVDKAGNISLIKEVR
ncbi:MAG: hypothetical protein IJ094_10900 [Bacilli bacterium]|nr:hypothetical protein [Bacilli bacterium]